MNTKLNMIIVNDRIVTSDVTFCKYNNQTHKYDITFKTGKTYLYNYNSVIWLKNPKLLDPNCCKVKHQEHELFGITAIYVFENGYKKYWHICFENKSERDYKESELQVITNCFNNTFAHNVFNYLKKTASLISLHADDGTNLLVKQYVKLDFVGDDKAFATYLNPSCYKLNNYNNVVPIFPFGCNASQFKAVKNALENQISVVQGPPGTGKTQTILNIIANLLIMGKTVQVVSNNNSATTNILEKLSSPKYNMGFLAAALGNTDNKKQFIQEQTGRYPEDVQSWNTGMSDNANFFNEVRCHSEELNSIFQKQERIALAKQELQELETELKYFEQYSKETGRASLDVRLRKKLDSKKLMQLWQECQSFVYTLQKLTFFFKFKSRFIYGISDWNFYRKNISEIIAAIQSLFYDTKRIELMLEIESLEKDLTGCNANKTAEEFSNMSMQYLKSILFNRYGKSLSRRVFTEEDLWKNIEDVQKEYPIVLSTTFSARSSLSKNAEFDYVIMDEASQVDIATGTLALSCAKNAVIVGDVKQLPNVVNSNDKAMLQNIFNSYQISPNYNLAEKSFLESVCDVIPNVPQTLLREHYRCHPKIINFCNQKFYNGNLVIMSKDNGEENVISVIKTAAGDHERDHKNQRQIDVLEQEVLPSLPFSSEEIGIISPYNNQVSAIRKVVPDEQTNIATVHKFQGREKDAIILTTVDDEVTEFSDNPYLLNVAVSRAKKYFCLIVSGNEQPKDSNIGDLIMFRIK